MFSVANAIAQSEMDVSGPILHTGTAEHTLNVLCAYSKEKTWKDTYYVNHDSH